MLITGDSLADDDDDVYDSDDVTMENASDAQLILELCAADGDNPYDPDDLSDYDAYAAPQPPLRA